jgi:hypothetical protein
LPPFTAPTLILNTLDCALDGAPIVEAIFATPPSLFRLHGERLLKLLRRGYKELISANDSRFHVGER